MEKLTITAPKIMLPVIAEHIEIAPGSAGGEARIAGRGIKVRDVVIWHEKRGAIGFSEKVARFYSGFWGAFERYCY